MSILHDLDSLAVTSSSVVEHATLVEKKPKLVSCWDFSYSFT